MACYGYMRVSSRDQNEQRQQIALARFEEKMDRIYLDKMSGKNFDRPAYIAMLLRLRRNDTVVVHAIDRLGRNYSEILEQWRIITKEKKANIVVLDMPLLDTRAKKDEDLTGMFISDLVLQILSYVAETERRNIKKRQAEGIAAAKLRGVRFGAPTKAIPPQFRELYPLWSAGKISARSAAKQLAVTHDTFLRWCKLKNSTDFNQNCDK